MFLFSLTACGGGGSSEAKPRPTPPTSGCNEALEFCGEIPSSADPCGDNDFWPLSAASSSRPLLVHFPQQANESKALEMLTLLEESWQIQVDELGFSAPASDAGACGPDGKFDVFIWPGIDGAFVSSIRRNPLTDHQDYSTYMAFDPSGISGGAFLNSFMAHELNHALQASDDWTESGQHYEAGATFAESIVYPDDDDWYFEMEDFQANPQWSLFFEDFGATWYTYAAAMYLHYLHERHYPGDPGFYARIWRGTRKAAPEERPDYIDALRVLLLNERGLTLDETVLEFMQWRWFVDEFDDGAHYARGAQWPYTVAFSDIDIAALPAVESLSAMVYGANYFRVTNSGASTASFTTTIVSSGSAVTWQLIDAVTGSINAPVMLEPSDSIVLIAVALPSGEVWTGDITFDLNTADLMLDPTP